MKNAFKLASLLFVGVLLFQISCEDDPVTPPPVIPDPTGQWALTLATLVDGDANTADADPLVIQNFTDGTVPPYELTIPVGDFQITSQLVGGALAAITCVNPANYASFFLELVADGNVLMFNCAGEGISESRGTWTLLQDDDGEYTILNLSVNLDGIDVPVAITLQNLVLTDTELSGTAMAYPMKKDLQFELSVPGNLQIITTDIVFKAK
jgi:hypothetical protein